MTPVTVNLVDTGQPDEATPPPGTAIVRLWRHVQAVRDRHAQRFTDPAEVAASRSFRAWSWALGEIEIAPVTDRPTRIPPTRSDIEVEIAAADERRLRGDREGRADAAATILRWLIGDDDHVPIRGQNPGELVGGVGDVVRTRELIDNVLALAAEGQCRAAAGGSDVAASLEDRQRARQEADYFDGVATTLTWVIGQRPETPITRERAREATARNLKSERVHAEDVIEQAKSAWITDRPLSPSYGEGVKHSVAWLLGDSAIPPLDPAGSLATGPTNELP